MNRRQNDKPRNKSRELHTGYEDAMSYGTRSLYEYMLEKGHIVDPYWRGYMHVMRLKFGGDGDE